MDENNRMQGTEDAITEVSLLDLLIIIAKHKKLLIITILLFTILGSVYSFTHSKSSEQNLPIEPTQAPRFVSSMKIMPLTPNTLRTGYFDTKASIFIANLFKSDIVLDKVLLDDGVADARDAASLRDKIASLSASIETKVDDVSGVIAVDVISDTQEHARKLSGYLLKSINSIVSDMWKQVDVQRKNIINDQIGDNLATVKSFKSALIRGKTITNNAEFNSFLDSQLTYWAFQQNQAYKNQDVMILYLVSPITEAPKEEVKADIIAADAGKGSNTGKTMLMFIILGVFVGLTLVFVRHFWQLSAANPATQNKLAELKKLSGFKTKSNAR